MSISVVIITKNEEQNLPRCLHSVKNVADEIIVLDSFSEDDTLNIARSFGAKVYTHKFEGYVTQKNLAAQKAGCDWVLSLDADEALSPELEQSVLQVIKAPQHDAYRFSRLTNYCGKWIKHCSWYPDKKVRLFRKNAGEWEGDQIHESWELHDKNAVVGELKGDLLHYSYYSFSDHIRQIEKFTEIAARAAAAKGKNCSLLKIWLGPKWRFFTDYILRLGFLDGYSGYMVCKYSAWAAFAKYSKIRQYARSQKLKQKVEAISQKYNYQPYG
ncbi:glycosyltransferase family 2 protein [Chitinophagaceae bacterium MMS25-I14]